MILIAHEAIAIRIRSLRESTTDDDAGMGFLPSSRAKEFERAIESRDAVGRQMGFAVSNPTKTSRATGLGIGSDAAVDSVDQANEATGFMNYVGETAYSDGVSHDASYSTNASALDGGATNQAESIWGKDAWYGFVAFILTSLALASAWLLRR